MMRLLMIAASAAFVLTLVLAGCGSTNTSPTLSATDRRDQTGEAASLVDVTGDVRDANGARLPADSWEADITSASIRMSDTDLELTIEQVAAIPSELKQDPSGAGGWLMYTLFIADEQGQILYMPRVQLVGSDWYPEVFDSQALQSIPMQTKPVVSGTTLACMFPLTALPSIKTPFKWAVGTEWSVQTGSETGDFTIFGDQAPMDNTEGYIGYPYKWAVFPS
jgi:hypothetical protein